MTDLPVRGPRRRLDTGRRREQLLRVGAELFAAHPYDEVSVDRMAELAGVSRGLLYHYFPTKRDFFLAVVRNEGERLLEMTDPSPGRPLRERLASGVDVYLRYAEEHTQGFRAFHRAAASADPEVGALHRDHLAEQERRIVAALNAEGDGRGLPAGEPLRLAVRGWLWFVMSVCLNWLDAPALSREEVRELCVRALFGAIATGPDAR